MAERTPDQIIEQARVLFDNTETSAARAFLRDGVSEFSGHPGQALQLITVLAELGSIDEALDSIEPLQAQHSGHWPVLARKFDLVCRAGDMVRAREALEALESAGEGRGAAPLLARARFHRLNGEPAQATEMEQQARALEPNSVQSGLHELDRLVAQNQSDEATERFATLRQAYPEDPRVHSRGVTLAHARSGLAAGLKRAGEMISRFPDFLPGYYQYGGFLEQSGRVDAAIETLQAAAARFPGNARPQVILAGMMQRAGRLDSGLYHAQQARALTPWEFEAVMAEAHALEALERYPEARNLLQDYLGRGQVAPSQIRSLIYHAIKADDAAAAASYARLGLELFPANPEILAELVQRSIYLGKLAPTDVLLKLLTDGTPPAQIVKKQVDLLIQTGEFEKAYAILLREGPRRGLELAVRLGRVLTGLAKFNSALRYMRFCLRRRPGDHHLVQAVTLAAIKSGKADEGIEILSSRDIIAATHAHGLAQLYFEVGDLQEGLRFYNDAKNYVSISYREISFYILSLIGSGDIKNTRRLISDYHAATSRANTHQRSTFFGQVVMEIEMELAQKDSASNRAVVPGDMADHAQLVLDFPRSNVAGMRFFHAWEKSGKETETVYSEVEIPAIVHQYWHDATPPQAISAMTDSWRAAEGFEHHLWNRETAIARLRSEFGPRWVRAMRMASNPAEEADLIRLCFLARDGGIYADADDILVGSLSQFVKGRAGLMVSMEARGFSLGNNFLAVRPGHPAIVLAARMVRQALLMRSSETTWSKTGPGVFTRAVARYMARQILQEQPCDVSIMPMGDALKFVNMHNQAPHKHSAGHWQASGRYTPVRALGEVLQEYLQGEARAPNAA